MNGGSIFSKLAASYNVIQPYLDKIDGELISQMNSNIKNVLKYLQQKPNDEGEKSQEHEL